MGVLFMQLLYSDMLPLKLKPGQEKFLHAFYNGMQDADRVEIATGYISKESLRELDSLAEKLKVKSIILTIGMYYIEGIPESIYHEALSINEKWRVARRGEIRLVRPFKYHGKVYTFYRANHPFKAFIGSHNLGAIKLEASNRRQYEISAMTEDLAEIQTIADFIHELQQKKCSLNIADIADIPLIREVNTSLNGVQEVSQLPITSVKLFKKHIKGLSFELPLKVPAFLDRHKDDNNHYTKSNINVCYAAPRSARKSRDWYETQLTVGVKVRRMPGYPKKHHPFFIVTDDGYWFKAHTTSDNNKQLSAVGNELLLGRWLKGRLVAAGLVVPVNDTQKDTERLGMITKEMLKAYGCNRLMLSKTDQKAIDDNNNELDVWMLTFEPTINKGE